MTTGERDSGVVKGTDVTKERGLILYVDDEWPNRLVFEQSFAKHYAVRVLESPHAALELLTREPVAVLVTDQRMPGMTGNELLARAKELAPDTVRVIITAYSDLDPILQAVNSGLVARYILKPWDRVELKQILEWALAQYTRSRESSTLQLRLRDSERLVTIGGIAAAVMHDATRPMVQLGDKVEDLLARVSPTLGRLLAETNPSRSIEDLEKLAGFIEELPAVVRELRVASTEVSELAGSLRSFLEPAVEGLSHAIDPMPVVTYAIAACQPAALRAGGRITWQGAETLPEVAIAQTELTQVLINLLENAVQAMKPEGGRVTVTAFEEASRVGLRIADDGAGMAADVLAKAGRPFFSTRREGAGLGIAQSRRLLERRGGVLRIETEEGKGTTVSVLLRRVL